MSDESKEWTPFFTKDPLKDKPHSRRQYKGCWDQAGITAKDRKWARKLYAMVDGGFDDDPEAFEVFDIAYVLARYRERCEALEARVAELEAKVPRG